MEGKTLLHCLDEEPVCCAREEGSLGDGPRFPISIVGEDERIELRNLSVANLTALRDQIDQVVRHSTARSGRQMGSRVVAMEAGHLGDLAAVF
jgi:hypothetical protein